MSRIKELMMNEYLGDFMVREIKNHPKLLVYGTLKKGFPFHEHYLAKADFLGDCDDLRGIMFHLGGYPAISLIEPRSPIIGEVYQVSPEELVQIDRLEGVPNHYHRIHQLIPKFGYTYVYVYPKESCARLVTAIPSGSWRGADTPTAKWLGWGKGFEVIGPPAPARVVSSTSYGPSVVPTAHAASGRPKPPKYHFEDSGTPGWVYLVNDDTGESEGPFKVVGETLREDGTVKPKIQWRPQGQQDVAWRPPGEDGPIVKAVKEATNKSLVVVPNVVTSKDKEPATSHAGPGVSPA